MMTTAGSRQARRIVGELADAARHEERGVRLARRPSIREPAGGVIVSRDRRSISSSVSGTVERQHRRDARSRRMWRSNRNGSPL